MTLIGYCVMASHRYYPSMRYINTTSLAIAIDESQKGSAPPFSPPQWIQVIVISIIGHSELFTARLIRLCKLTVRRKIFLAWIWSFLVPKWYSAIRVCLFEQGFGLLFAYINNFSFWIIIQRGGCLWCKSRLQWLTVLYDWWRQWRYRRIQW